MTKSRKAKNKNKDFQKVKLKIGKKLPKGQNETTTAFKSASVQIREQLKQKDGSQPLTQKKLNIQELLVQCLHYNTTVRSDAVSGILELLKTSPTVLENNLNAILERSSSMILDKEYNVRQRAIQVMKHAFSVLSASQISPFFPLISAHITCAMTHLAEPIQQDSLAAVDICLDAYPDLMNASAARLLPCFVKQIAAPGGKSGGQYTLVTNPSSKKSSQSWRLQVLGRLRRVLHSLAAEKQPSSADSDVKAETTVEWKSKPSCQIFTSEFTANTMSVVKISASSQTTEEQDKMTEFITDITPLLSQCWIESRPTNFTPGSSLSLECLNLIDTVLSIYQLFRKFVDDGSLFEKQITHYFLPYFPYSLQRRKSDNKSKQTHISPDVINLRMCDLLTETSEDSKNATPSWLSTVVAYLERVLSNTSQQKSLLHTVVKTVLNKWPQESETLLKKSFRCFSQSDNVEDVKSWIAFFREIAFSTKSALTASQEMIITNWVLTLPLLLVNMAHESKQLTIMILSAINQAALRRTGGLLEQLKVNIGKLLEKDLWRPERKIDTSYLLNLLIWTPKFDQKDLKKLKTCLLQNPELCIRFLEHLQWCQSEGNQSKFTDSLYLSLLFSLLQCEKDTCCFEAVFSDESNVSEMQRQVGRNLRGLQRDIKQLRDLYEQFRSLL